MTGGTGLVGSGIMAAFEARGCDVWSLARGASSRVACDLSAPGAALEIQRRVPRCDAVVHAAALISGQADELVAANVLGSVTVVELATAWHAWLTVISTVSLVDPAYSRHADENAPLLPRSTYHVTKLAGEQLARIALPGGCQVLRIPAPLGRRMPATRFVPTLVRAAISGNTLNIDGHGTREQTYVDVLDVGEAAAAAVQARIAGTFNVAGAESHSNLDVARTVLAVTDSQSPIATGGRADPEDDTAWRVPIRHVREAFGWQPTRTLADSIRELAREFRGQDE